MRNRFNVDSDEKQRILLLHENSLKNNYLNLIVEQEWLTFPGDKNYTYQKQNNKWVAKNKAGKVYDMSKYPSSVAKLEKQFPGGKSSTNVSSTAETPTNATVKNETLGTAITPQGTKLMDELSKTQIGKSVIDNLTKANFDFNKMKPEQLIPTLQKYSKDMLDKNPNILPEVKSDLEKLLNIKLPEITPATNVTVKNETLPGAPVYYPWIQDGKVSFDKLKQTLKSDPNLQNWYSNLTKLNLEQIKKVEKDFLSNGFPQSSTPQFPFEGSTSPTLVVRSIIQDATKIIEKNSQQG